MPGISKNDIEKIQVSSVMRNDKNFGKQNIFDGNEETCWSSDEGSPQWIKVDLKEKHLVSAFRIQFQGGFVGQNCKAEFINENSTFSHMFYPNDENAIQNFKLSEPVICKQIKFIFEKSSDFFGRVIVYFIDIVTEKLHNHD